MPLLEGVEERSTKPKFCEWIPEALWPRFFHQDGSAKNHLTVNDMQVMYQCMMVFQARKIGVEKAKEAFKALKSLIGDLCIADWRDLEELENTKPTSKWEQVKEPNERVHENLKASRIPVCMTFGVKYHPYPYQHTSRIKKWVVAESEEQKLILKEYKHFYKTE